MIRSIASSRDGVDRRRSGRILPHFKKAGRSVSAKGGDSENAGRARQGRRVVRERHEALQEAVREGGHPERDQEARALRKAVGQAQEEGAGGEEARPEEGAEGNDVVLSALNPHLFPTGPARRSRAGPLIEKRCWPNGSTRT